MFILLDKGRVVLIYGKVIFCIVIDRRPRWATLYSEMSSRDLLSRYQGCLLGAVFGDCLGAKFEQDWTEIPCEKVIGYIKKITQKVKNKNLQEGAISYTDDTCMTFDLAKSLVQNKKYDPTDVGKNFSETYFNLKKSRAYGSNVTVIFHRLKRSHYAGDVYQPAREQFNGSGSYGNGSAMRVSPVPLFHHNDISKIVKLAAEQSKLTHTHPLGINGAILQSLAIEKALLCNNISDPVDFCEELIHQLKAVSPVKNELKVYERQCCHIMQYLKSKDVAKLKQINDKIGSDVTAEQAISAAILSFLYTLDENRVLDLKKFNGFMRAVIFAVALGHDSDTVGSMAAAIAGAYYGVEMIPEEWKFACEGSGQALKLAQDLYQLNQNNSKPE